MTQVRLTRRGKIVRNTIITLITVAALLWLNNATIPDECKVPFEEMSTGCVKLLFPS